MDEKRTCPQHEWCMVKIEQLNEDVSELKKEKDRMKKEIQDIIVTQVKDSEKIITLYNVVNDIKDYLKEIKEDLKKQSQKPDPFKETVWKIVSRIFEIAIMGGLMAYFMNK